MADRIQKEKEFHNNRFDKETRDSLNKYYSVSLLIVRYYQKKLFGESIGKRVLEYGCGLGSHSFEVAKNASEVCGIDISEVAIEKATGKAKKEGINNIFFRVMNAESLEFSNNSFDVVCGTSILHHLDLKSAYSELSRVLKPEGKAYFIEPLGHNPLINLFRKLTSNLRTEDEHPLLKSDINLLTEYFSYINIKYYFLTSLLAIPLRRRKHFESILHFLNLIDQTLFKLKIFQNQAWQVVIETGAPKKKSI